MNEEYIDLDLKEDEKKFINYIIKEYREHICGVPNIDLSYRSLLLNKILEFFDFYYDKSKDADYLKCKSNYLRVILNSNKLIFWPCDIEQTKVSNNIGAVLEYTIYQSKEFELLAESHFGDNYE